VATCPTAGAWPHRCASGDMGVVSGRAQSGGRCRRRSGGALQLGPAGRAGDLLVDDLAGGLFAAAAAAADGQATLYVEERRRPTLDLLANIAIGDGMADADVHDQVLSKRPTIGSVGIS